MGLDTRPPSVYELLTKEHIVEENTKEVAFYMPRDTHKSLHITRCVFALAVHSYLSNCKGYINEKIRTVNHIMS